MTNACERVRRAASRQDGVVSRRQVLAAGVSDDVIARRLAAERWRRVHPGVYATFTGPLPWESRCWAAVLYAGEGAALADDAALRSWKLRATAGHQDVITVAVDHTRRVESTDGVAVVRIRRLARLVHPARTPRRLRLESALLLKASTARCPDDVIGVLAGACQQRRTTAERLREALAALPRNLRYRRVVTEVLDDVSSGAYSFLEVHYLRDVERPHGLPTGKRQRRVRQGRRSWFRDVDYLGLGVVVELDGRLGHEDFDGRSADMTRDNGAEVDRRRTIRAGYRHVMSQACGSAVVVVQLLWQQGWAGMPKACGPGCPVGALVASREPRPAGAGEVHPRIPGGRLPQRV